MGNHLSLRDLWFFHMTSSMERILWEILVTRVIILLLGVVALNMVRFVIMRILIVIYSSIFVKIIIVRVAHWIIQVE